MSSTLWAVLPGGIDDPATPSGGNRYDRQVLDLLAAGIPANPAGIGADPASERQDGPVDALAAPGSAVAAREVHELVLAGDWPMPGPEACAAVAETLAALPDDADVLLDGLVACAVPQLLAPHAHRLRLIILVHLPLGDETGLTAATKQLLQSRERQALHLAAAVIATSAEAAAHLRALHGLATVAVASPGVEPAALAEPAPTGHRLLCVARVTPRKGQDLLVDVLQQHLTDLPWACTFVGAISEPVPHTHENIHFTGALTGAALDARYAAADLLVLASRAETYGMVVTEALARGIPVLATAVGGVTEALGTAADGTRPGQLIRPDNPAELAAALRAWLTDGELRARWRAAARFRRENLPRWSQTARLVAEVLDHRTEFRPAVIARGEKS